MTPSIADPPAFRLAVVGQLSPLFSADVPDPGIFAADLERGVFNWALEEADRKRVLKKWANKHFVCIYTDRLRTIVYNLSHPTGGDVIAQTKQGRLRPHVFAYMTHQEMCPEKWATMTEKKRIRDQRACETDISAATDTFTCRKCKSNKCTYYQMQTRAADEPMTTFVTCLACDNRWKC
jgi:transcription elongation factor S-II